MFKKIIIFDLLVIMLLSIIALNCLNIKKIDFTNVANQKEISALIKRHIEYAGDTSVNHSKIEIKFTPTNSRLIDATFTVVGEEKGTGLISLQRLYSNYYIVLEISYHSESGRDILVSFTSLAGRLQVIASTMVLGAILILIVDIKIAKKQVSFNR